MDGPTIQEASTKALSDGATPASIVAALGEVDAGVPLVVMTYYNIVFRGGHRRVAPSFGEDGGGGAPVPHPSPPQVARRARGGGRARGGTSPPGGRAPPG